jgi:hypothetical protein
MTRVASSPPKQGQLVNVRSRNWMVTDVSTNTLPPPVLDLDVFFDSVCWGAAFTADVKNIQAPFRSGIDIEDDLSWLFAFEEPLTELRDVRGVANEAGEEITFATATRSLLGTYGSLPTP